MMNVKIYLDQMSQAVTDQISDQVSYEIWSDVRDQMMNQVQWTIQDSLLCPFIQRSVYDECMDRD